MAACVYPIDLEGTSGYEREARKNVHMDRCGEQVFIQFKSSGVLEVMPDEWSLKNRDLLSECSTLYRSMLRQFMVTHEPNINRSLISKSDFFNIKEGSLWQSSSQL